MRVNLRADSYDVRVGRGLLHDLGPAVRRLVPASKCVVVTDPNVRQHHAAAALASLREGGFDEPIVCVIPPGETNKTLATITGLIDQVLPRGIDRRTPVIALGGGIVGDVGGFLAATVLRGVPFFQVPTTLLAMVDASVGGKVGVNHVVGKNLIGAFKQPAEVIIDPQLLATLPPRELRGGLAECVKHEIIRDAAGFAALEANFARALLLDLDYLSDLVAHNVAIKAAVVEADPNEHGERAHLNLGHTFGHAIETVCGYTYSHGEAVSLGLCCATFAAQSLGLIDAAVRPRVVGLLARIGLPTAAPGLDMDAVVAALRFDKKAEGPKIRFVLPDGLGRATIRDDLPAELVRSAVSSLTGPHIP